LCTGCYNKWARNRNTDDIYIQGTLKKLTSSDKNATTEYCADCGIQRTSRFRNTAVGRRCAGCATRIRRAKATTDSGNPHSASTAAIPPVANRNLPLEERNYQQAPIHYEDPNLGDPGHWMGPSGLSSQRSFPPADPFMSTLGHGQSSIFTSEQQQPGYWQRPQYLPPSAATASNPYSTQQPDPHSQTSNLQPTFHSYGHHDQPSNPHGGFS
jgi:hypothetical protein